MSFVRWQMSRLVSDSVPVHLIVSPARLPTVGDRAFQVAAARVWNSLPDLVTSAPSVAVFRSRLKLKCLTFPTPVIVQCLRSDSSCFGHYNRSCLLLLTYFTNLHLIVIQTLSL